jgi:TetR/AcrR family transcriptional regulator
MRKPLTKESSGGRASRTRAEILSSAEQLFASRGFDATRLEDVAEEVGLTRAALFYHFRDKQTLFDAMVANAFASLNQQLHDLLDAEELPIPERLERAVEAWVDEIVARPTLARLILRFVADGYEQASQRIFWDDHLLPQKFFLLFEEGKRTGVLKPLHDDPFHTASAIIGTTFFYVGALATLIPQGLFEPLEPKQLQAHKQEAVHSLRRLLGFSKSKAA